MTHAEPHKAEAMALLTMAGAASAAGLSGALAWVESLGCWDIRRVVGTALSLGRRQRIPAVLHEFQLVLVGRLVALVPHF